MTPMLRRHAFTLIELLIVVAIIAILAAIAVPNFLEAQVRSKVSRTRADMRSEATALMAYTVDYNRTPLCPQEYYERSGSWAGVPSADVTLRPLTTPVAYITSLPDDVFAIKGYTDAGGAAFQGRKTFGYRTCDNMKVEGGQILPRGKNDWGFQAWTRGYAWEIHSLGPMKTMRNPDTGTNAAPIGVLIGDRPDWLYDPSNGTISYGFLITTNKGPVLRADTK